MSNNVIYVIGESGESCQIRFTSHFCEGHSRSRKGSVDARSAKGPTGLSIRACATLAFGFYNVRYTMIPRPAPRFDSDFIPLPLPGGR